MAQYYLDIETTGIDPLKDQIITIQYQEVDKNTGQTIGELRILKAWESSEKEILEEFIYNTKILDSFRFSFVSVGFNLNFEHNFLKTRSEKHGLPQIDVLNHPFLDLQTISIMMNKGEFKGSSLDKLAGKEKNGSKVPIWYANKEFDKIIEYVKMEAREFIRFNSWLYKKLPNLLIQFREENGLNEKKV